MRKTIKLSLIFFFFLVLLLFLFFQISETDREFIWKESEKEKENILSPKVSLLFVGDIMLDRGVEVLLEREGFSWPFLKISDFLKKRDFVVANLEGALLFDPPVFGPRSLSFAFSYENLFSLEDAGFTHFSLSNNHTLNAGQSGLEETKENLREGGFSFFGDPLNRESEVIFEDEFVIFGFNWTFPDYRREDFLLENVRDLSQKHSEKLLVVYIHWGEEYELKSAKSQRELARKMIDEGADLVVGSHPHVVQEIEVYKDRAVFYSLGNFVFDQYFSEDVQKGLIVEPVLFPERIEFNLYPVGSKKSQPFLMQGEEKEKFLEELASRSSEDYREEIRRGYFSLPFLKNNKD